MSIGLRIKELRKDKNLSQQDLAVSVGVDSSQFSKIEQGKLLPTIQQLMELSSKLEVSVDWLCFGKHPLQDKVHVFNEPKSFYSSSVGIPFLTDELALHFDAIASLGDLEHFNVPGFAGADFLVAVKGTAMYPSYNNGDVVACKDLDLKELFYQWGKVYVVKTHQGILIKRIEKAASNAHLLLVSDNESYDVVTVARTEVLAVAIVVGLIKQV